MQRRLADTWVVINIQDLSEPVYYEEWTFTQNDDLIIYRETSHPNFPQLSNSAKYEMISGKFFKITGFDDKTLQYYNYTWEIVFSQKDKLRVVNDQDGNSGLFFREFERKGTAEE